MKTLISIIITLLIINCSFSIVSAQTPQAIPYQAVARDVNGNLIANQSISLRLSIVDQYIFPMTYYQETQTVSTNALGLFTANVGQGTPVINFFYDINWAGGFAKFLKVEMDVAGGTNYVDMGSSPLLSVPYSLYSAKSGNGMTDGSTFGSTMYWNGAVWDNNTNIYNGGLNVGIGTSSPTSKLEVVGTTTTSNLAITNGAAPGYLLQSDANGNASWTNPASIIGPEIDPQVSSATTNNVPKWNGTTLTDGSIYDNGKVGIGTTTPEFKLSLDNDGAIIAKGAYNTGAILTTTGSGARLIWYPRKGAFRAGAVSGDFWDEVNIGFGSFATGLNTKATGDYSTAMGVGCVASGDYSFAQGNSNAAGNYQSVAMGNDCNAYGIRSFAIGDQCLANHQSRALGNNAEATGIYATAIGNFVTASGFNTCAMGNWVSTNGQEGAFSIGDNSTSTSATMLNSTSPNSFNSRFAGGYTFYTDSITTTANAMFLNNGKAGLGTPTPEFKLSLDNDGGIIAKGVPGFGTTLTTTGYGTRMIWYPKRGAFRAGQCNGTEWDDANTGNSSFAAGTSVKASGHASVALGNGAEATNSSSIALGQFTDASAPNSTAMGLQSTASGEQSFVMGSFSIASGMRSVAIGGVAFASELESIAIGSHVTSSGTNSLSMGLSTTASGDYSTAMGNYVSTNNREGAFIIGDRSTFTVMNSINDNGFKARFDGGYALYSNSTLSSGVFLASGASAWTVVSDRNKKENFRELNNEDILVKLGALPMSEWNYKAQAKEIRHIGPMAQDFYAAFHLDGESDTTINSLDIDGINMAAIQALKTRTDELKKATDKIEALTASLAKLEQRVDALAKENATVSVSKENK